MKKRLGPALAVLLLITLAGCGGRPSEDDLADALQDKDNNFFGYLGARSFAEADDEVIDCMAKVLHDSDISDEGLELIADDKLDKPRIAGSISAADDGEFSDDDVKALARVLPEVMDCAV
ncbi:MULTISPECIES: hypothetical protein [unclassified Nocardioides]|uniref:hypothetical protein n=1 Tax=unclassified Nocardioides TaxID=2615069 RepID=UPI0006F9D3A8|nr:MULTISPECIES: hypothetical protein [unclassified Nocardioides]KQY57068.1 hypothetical protein ASD30_12460 [Nocardioides sp. Root140]KRF11708.1 hypothetical protein ASH02_17105 [Nocardioides sp. Soil796]